MIHISEIERGWVRMRNLKAILEHKFCKHIDWIFRERLKKLNNSL